MKIGTFDLETNQLELDDNLRLDCLVVYEHDSDDPVTRFSADPDRIPGLPLSEITEFLESFDILIGHNCIDFDFPVLTYLFGWNFKGIIYDTLIVSRMQNPFRLVPPNCPNKTGPHSVEAWGWRLGRGKVQYEDWHEYTPEKMHRCVEDTHIQYLIWQALTDERQKAKQQWLPAIRLTCKLFQNLKRQSLYGWTFDVELANHCLYTLDRWKNKIDQSVQSHLPMVMDINENKEKGEYNFVRKPFLKNGDYSAITERWLYGYRDPDGTVNHRPHDLSVCGPFSRISFRRLDLDSNAEVKDFFLSLGWVPKEWNLDSEGNKRSPKMSKDETFEGMQGSLGKLLAKRVQIRHRHSNITGLLNHVRPDGRISTTYTGMTPTARLKHSVVVNIPGEDAFFGKRMRELFKARDGWKLVGVDSKGNQVRQLAARMKNDEFTHAVLSGTKENDDDHHSLTRKKVNVKTRTEAKNFFYGVIFGSGDKKAGKLVGGDVEAGRKAKNDLFDGLPGFRELLDHLTKQWRATAKKAYNPKFGRTELRDGYIIGIDGRPIFIDSEHKILNYTLQSDEGIQMALAYCWFHTQMEKRGYKFYEDWGMLIWYHDEYQFECRPEIAEEAAKLAEESIAEAGRILGIEIEHAGEAKIGVNWKETH